MQAWDEYTKAAGGGRGVRRRRGPAAQQPPPPRCACEDGERMLTDGPFAETKEQLGGFYLIDCKDLDEAIDWAAGSRAPRRRRQRSGRSWTTRRRARRTRRPQRERPRRRHRPAGRRRLFRHESGRAVATLIRILGDFDLAEEAVQEAFVVALERWPRDGAAGQPRRLDRPHGPQPRDRPPAPRAPLRGQAARAGAADAGTARRPGRRHPSPTTGCGCSSPAATRRSPRRRGWR